MPLFVARTKEVAFVDAKFLVALHLCLPITILRTVHGNVAHILYTHDFIKRCRMHSDCVIMPSHNALARSFSAHFLNRQIYFLTMM